MQLYDINGSYYPSFFYMLLETNEDISTALDKYTQTFVHEFIHYLQDLILPYNIRLNLTNLALFGDIRQSVMETGELVRPFTKWNENSVLLRDQRKYTLGKSEFLNNRPCIESIKKDYFVIPSTGAKVYKYALMLKHPKKKYHIGAMDMLEYIAHKIESKHYGVNTYYTPYKTIDYIFDFYQLPDIPVDTRLCIVEYCLYNDNPIHVLFKDFLDNNFVKDHKNIFIDYNRCYETLLHNTNWTAVGGFNETVISKTLRRLENFREVLTNHFNAPQFGVIIRWLEIVSNYVGAKFVDKFVFSDMFHMSLQGMIDNINDIIDAIGFPLILNKANKCISMLPFDDDSLPFLQFYILQKFLLHVETKEKSCPIYEMCNANGFICNKSCKVSPSLNVNDNGDCPYSMFLKSYNLASAF